MTSPLNANQALRALLALGVRYTADVNTDGRWTARCPACRTPGALMVRETRERDLDDEHPPVNVGCTRRCTTPAELASLLARDLDLLELRAERDRWRALAHDLAESLSLQLAIGGDTNTAIVHTLAEAA